MPSQLDIWASFNKLNYYEMAKFNLQVKKYKYAFSETKC